MKRSFSAVAQLFCLRTQLQTALQPWLGFHWPFGQKRHNHQSLNQRTVSRIVCSERSSVEFLARFQTTLDENYRSRSWQNIVQTSQVFPQFSDICTLCESSFMFSRERLFYWQFWCCLLSLLRGSRLPLPHALSSECSLLISYLVWTLMLGVFVN